VTRDTGATAPAIEIRGVVYAYERGGPRAVDDVSLDVPSGQLVAVAGPNGSGKTTLARLLNGLLLPTAGTVVVDGLETARYPVRALAARVGFAFQDPNQQLFARTVAQELAFGPRNLGVGTDEVRARVAETAARLGLEPLLGEHPRRLGPGLRKLVSIAAVLTMRTPIVVLDEPTTGQDHRTAGSVVALVRELRAAGTTVVCVTHDTSFLAEVADRIVVLVGGRIVADGAPAAVFADERTLAAARLEPPQVARLARRLGLGDGPVLSVDDLAASLRRAGLVAPPATPEPGA
jgi:energy-coupling factor transport system ATP-binding protein